MIILCTAILFNVIAKHGVVWEGVGAAWFIAALFDLVIMIGLIHLLEIKIRNNY